MYVCMYVHTDEYTEASTSTNVCLLDDLKSALTCACGSIFQVPCNFTKSVRKTWFPMSLDRKHQVVEVLLLRLSAVVLGAEPTLRRRGGDKLRLRRRRIPGTAPAEAQQSSKSRCNGLRVHACVSTRDPFIVASTDRFTHRLR